MPILVDSANFTDAFGTTTPFYKGNTGDEVTVELDVRANIRMTSVGNPLTLDPTTNQVQSAGISWLDSGFRVGQDVYVTVLTSGGSLLVAPNNPFWTSVSYVDDLMIDLTGTPIWYSIGASQIVVLTAVLGSGSTTALPFDELNLKFNQVLNATPGAAFSLIDSEVTRANIQGISSLGIGGIAPGLLLGNQSGSFLKSAEVERVVNIDQFYKYKVRLVFTNQGMYNPEWFFSSDCLKAWISSEWSVVVGEPFNPITGTYSLDADTGYYDEAFNASGVINSSIVQGITEIDYCVPTVAQIIVDGPILDVGLGACYVSTNDDYYRNQAQSQYNLAMIIPTNVINNFLLPVNSELNTTGAGFTIEMTAITQVGTITTIDITITPNGAFQTFIDSRDPQDRLFQLWVRCGNLNLLIFNDQLTCDPPVGGPLIMEQSYAFLDHSENVNDVVGDYSGFECNTEDDLAYVGRFLLDKNVIHQSFSIKIEAFNSFNDDDFTLQEVTFGFATVPISGDGRYLLNETVPIIQTLPSTSEKREATLTLDPTLDTPTQYGVKIYAPWLMNWKYWLNQTNASVDFWPTQNQNWVQYDDNLTAWTVREELELIREGLAYSHRENIDIKDYDSQPFIVQNIDLYVDATNVIVGIVTEGMLMRVVAYHEITNGQVWNPSDVWGMITVEPWESERRWICSTAVDFDNDLNNPLYPLSTLLMDITFPSPNIARMECYFNPDLIDLTNSVKFTTKIKGCPTDESLVKTLTDGSSKTTTFSTDKTLAL